MTADLIELRGGLIVRVDAILLALDLEAKGHALTAKDGALLVSQGSTLTGEEKRLVKELRRHLLALAAYEPPEVV